jgi:hypothetical protein
MLPEDASNDFRTGAQNETSVISLETNTGNAINPSDQKTNAKLVPRDQIEDTQKTNIALYMQEPHLPDTINNPLENNETSSPSIAQSSVGSTIGNAPNEASSDTCSSNSNSQTLNDSIDNIEDTSLGRNYSKRESILAISPQSSQLFFEPVLSKCDPPSACNWKKTVDVQPSHISLLNSLVDAPPPISDEHSMSMTGLSSHSELLSASPFSSRFEFARATADEWKSIPRTEKAMVRTDVWDTFWNFLMRRIERRRRC